jgi:hypothetical protein
MEALGDQGEEFSLFLLTACALFHSKRTFLLFDMLRRQAYEVDSYDCVPRWQYEDMNALHDCFGPRSHEKCLYEKFVMRIP